MLKGFITQNDLKQYEITTEGKQALDFLFREAKEENSGELIKISPNTSVDSLEKKISLSKFYHEIFSLPLYFYNISFGLFLVLSTVLVMLEPKITFFHFIPMFITENWSGIIPLMWVVISVSLFSAVYFYQKIKPNLATYGLFFLYFDFYFTMIIIINLFRILQFQELYQVISLVFQGLYIISWVFLLSYDCWTWEKSLLTSLLQNYGFLI